MVVQACHSAYAPDASACKTSHSCHPHCMAMATAVHCCLDKCHTLLRQSSHTGCPAAQAALLSAAVSAERSVGSSRAAFAGPELVVNLRPKSNVNLAVEVETRSSAGSVSLWRRVANLYFMFLPSLAPPATDSTMTVIACASCLPTSLAPRCTLVGKLAGTTLPEAARTFWAGFATSRVPSSATSATSASAAGSSSPGNAA